MRVSPAPAFAGTLCPMNRSRTSTALPARLLAVALGAIVTAFVPVPAQGQAPPPAKTPSVAPERPLILAHRGASAYLPEHTLAAYAAAHAMGADYIEPDVVMTKDGVLICSHDLTLEGTTDVAAKFPGRARQNGSFYAIDFTLAEIRTLSRLGREGPPGPRLPGHPVPTLEEFLEMLSVMNRRTGREVGVIPEPKEPDFHRKHGRSIEPVLLELLRRYGYASRDDRAIIQCFDPWSLRAMREALQTDLRLVYLSGQPIPDVVLNEIANYCDGIGPKHTLLAQKEDGAWKPTDLAGRARARGLTLWPYTLAPDPVDTARFLKTVPVDGFFTDFPDRGLIAVDLATAGTAATDEQREELLRRFRDAVEIVERGAGRSSR